MNHPRKTAFRILTFLVITISLLGATLFSTPAAWQGAYLPLVGRGWPTESPYNSPLLISEVFYDPGGSDPEPAAEWIEVYQRGETPLDLSGFKIGDGETWGDGEGMFSFPEGVTGVLGQVIVIANQANAFMAAYGFKPSYELNDTDPDVPDMVKYSMWAKGVVNLSNSGDEVLLLDGENLIADAVSWGSSTFAFDPSVAKVPQGHSLERKPAQFDSDLASDWIDLDTPMPGEVDLTPPTATITQTPTFTGTPLSCGQLTLLVTEVLYDPLGSDDPDGEWFEIYNPGESPVNLGCVKIGDEETSGGGEGMFTFSPGASQLAGEVILVANRATTFFSMYGFNPDYELVSSDPEVPDLVKYSAWAGGTLNLSNGGDDVLILDGDDLVIEAVSWGSSTFAFDPSVAPVAEGHSLERQPAGVDTNTAMDWIDQPFPTPGWVDLTPPTFTPTSGISITPTWTETPLPCGMATLLISEVLYDPPDFVDPDGEWIEIYNTGVEIINMACVKVGDEETVGGGEAMLTFPPGTTVLPAGVVVIANRADSFLATYAFKPNFEIEDSDPAVPDMIKYTTWASGYLNLSNSGDDVLILDGNDQLVDAVSWGSSTFAFDPPVPTVVAGHSLERRPGNQDTDTAADWVDQLNPAPGVVDLTPSTPAPSFTPTPTPKPTRTKTPTPRPTRTKTPTAVNTPTPTPAVSGMVINEIHADPALLIGDANGDGSVDGVEDEFVEIVNNTLASVDLSGWTLADGVGTRHTFPAGSILISGCSVLVFGGGSPTGSFGNSLVQVSSSGTLGLNGLGDMITLYNLASIVVASYSYGLEGGDDQSLTRAPDIIGGEPLVKHSLAEGSGGAIFSPGTRLDGIPFGGCPH